MKQGTDDFGFVIITAVEAERLLVPIILQEKLIVVEGTII